MIGVIYNISFFILFRALSLTLFLCTHTLTLSLSLSSFFVNTQTVTLSLFIYTHTLSISLSLFCLCYILFEDDIYVNYECSFKNFMKFIIKSIYLYLIKAWKKPVNYVDFLRFFRFAGCSLNKFFSLSLGIFNINIR